MEEPSSRKADCFGGVLVLAIGGTGHNPRTHTMRCLPTTVVAALSAATILLVVRLPTARAQAPPDESQIRIARLIRQLGSESYRDRFEAGDALEKIGPECRRALEAATLSDDAEVRLRAADLLKRFKADDLWLPGLVSCSGRGQPASQVLATVAEQSGNHLTLGAPYGSFTDAKVDLDYPSGQFWPVVDDICRQTGNQVRSDFEGHHRGAAIVAGSPGKFPTAYSGPLRAQITEEDRDFSEKLHFADGRSEQSQNFEMELNVRWEDRFHPVAARALPEVVEAITDTGVRLTGPATGGNSWSVLGASERQLSARIKLNPPPMAARQLDRLVLRWGIIAVGDPTGLTIDDLSSHQAVRQDDVEATIERMEQHDGGRLEISLLVARDGPLPEPQEVLFQEYGAELFDAGGQTIHLQSQSNLLTERGAQLRLTFGGDFSQNPPKTLRLTYPRIRDKRDVEMVFRHVPLPTGRPE